MNQIEQIFSRLQTHNPEPKGELIHHDPFTLLIAVVLSAQATDAGVNKATPALFAAAPTPESMLELGEESLKSYIQTIGLYRTKAKHIIQLCRILVERHNSQVPCTREDLMTLPGVGRKTANVVLSIAFEQPTIAVDTHVYRVARRLGLSEGCTPLEVEQDLERIIPKTYMHHAHHWLILHGRYVCVARKPRCSECFLSDLCQYTAKNS